MVRAQTQSCSSRMRCSVRSRPPKPRARAVHCVSLGLCVNVHRDPEMVQSDLQSATVFVIDDDADVRASIAGLLKSVGLRVETFESALEFLSCGRSGVPGCLVLDFTLRDMNGFDAQRVLADNGVHIPIIFMSADGDIPTSARAMRSGAVEFLAKPFEDQHLLDAIQEALNRDRAMRQK